MTTTTTTTTTNADSRGHELKRVANTHFVGPLNFTTFIVIVIVIGYFGLKFIIVVIVVIVIVVFFVVGTFVLCSRHRVASGKVDQNSLFFDEMLIFGIRCGAFFCKQNYKMKCRIKCKIW